MNCFPDFNIEPKGEISDKFLELHISTFYKAMEYVKSLPYRRIYDTNMLSVLHENCGTCSTKHGVIKLLAEENNFDELLLKVGIFNMNAKNTPKVADRLKSYHLLYMPEAHCYLKHKNNIIDITTKISLPSDFIEDLVEEIEILTNQIVKFKVKYHKSYLSKWLQENKEIKCTIEELWKIREQCIGDLSK